MSFALDILYFIRRRFPPFRLYRVVPMPVSNASALDVSTPSADELRLGVTSETDPLQHVIVHTPGQEVALVAPDSRLDLLFDDILFVDQAREEHRLMQRVFRKVVGRADATLQISTLLEEALAEDDARFDFVDQICGIARVTNVQAFEAELKQFTPEELLRFALTGASPIPINVPPLPNLMFTRDLAAVVHDHVIISYPATAARQRESIVIKTILNHHPSFAPYRDRIVELPPGVTFEGGDLLVAGPNTVLIGLSERTSFGGVMAVAEALFAATPVDHVLMVDVPKRRSYMHLDTVFTFSTPDECVVFPPLFVSDDPGNVVHFTRGDAPGRFTCEVKARLKDTLEALLDRSLTFIPCGGNDLLDQQREQWTDGANFFCIAPGVVIGYERNGRTFEMMGEYGYRVTSAEAFLSYYAESDFASGEKVAIKLAGTELSRGRGGPRCMTLPLARRRS